MADRRETVIESRAARAFRRIAGRRVFPASNQAGIHRICCQSAAPSPPPSPPRVSALSGPRVRVTRRAMTRESTRLENRGNPVVFSLLSARQFQSGGERKGNKTSSGGIWLFRGFGEAFDLLPP